MTAHTPSTAAASFIALFFSTAVALASDLETLTAICADCHGPNGLSQHDDIPILAGQAYTVIADNLFAFRAGERPCTETLFRHGDTSRPATSMCAIAGSLGDADIEVLAEFFESQPFVPARQEFAASRVARGRAIHEQGQCDACHAEGGRLTNELACRLAGQWTPYLRQAFTQIRAGERFGPAVMNDAIRGLTDEEIEDLLAFYASQAE